MRTTGTRIKAGTRFQVKGSRFFSYLVPLASLLLLIAIPAQALDPGPFDITVYANEDYQLNLTHTAAGVPVNLTGYQYRLQAKKPGAAAPFLTMSSVIVNAAAGQTRHTLTKAATAALANMAGIYDLMQIAPGGSISYLMQGKIRILETVTR